MKAEMVLVTGATSFLGNHLVRELLAKGVRVRALTRSASHADKYFARLPVEVVEGNLNSTGGLNKLVSGVDLVLHVAECKNRCYRESVRWTELVETNVVGTTYLLLAAYRAGVRRFLHFSSARTLGGKGEGECNELQLRLESDADAYERSKILAELEVQRFLRLYPQMWAAMILPDMLVGPGWAEREVGGSPVLDLFQGRLPFRIDAKMSVADVRDVAKAALRVVEKGRRGERYLAAGRHLSMDQLLQWVNSIGGVRVKQKNLSPTMLHLRAWLEDWQARIGRRPTGFGARMLRRWEAKAQQRGFDHQKIMRELDVVFQPLEESLRDEICWYHKQGWLGVPTAGLPMGSGLPAME